MAHFISTLQTNKIAERRVRMTGVILFGLERPAHASVAALSSVQPKRD
jgi:hypothetical protein